MLLKRFEDTDNKLPGVTFIWADQGGYSVPLLNSEINENPGFGLLVQDRFEYDADEKWAAFLAGMAEETTDPTVGLNFLSTKGHAKYGHPYGFARKLNNKLADAPDAVFNGWIIVDFGSARLAEHIYSANFN